MKIDFFSIEKCSILLLFYLCTMSHVSSCKNNDGNFNVVFLTIFLFFYCYHCFCFSFFFSSFEIYLQLFSLFFSSEFLLFGEVFQINEKENAFNQHEFILSPLFFVLLLLENSPLISLLQKKK